MSRTLLFLLFALAGCASPPPNPTDAGRLTLLAPLAIPAASATLRLQYGKPVARDAVQEQDPFCVFEINTVSDGPQTVRPDSFRITRHSHAISSIAEAALPWPALTRVAWFDDDRPTHIYYKTLFRLESATQPGVRLLTCMSNQNLPGLYPFMRHLGLEEIRAALGADFRLELR
jgi:hypothetical protein